MKRQVLILAFLSYTLANQQCFEIPPDYCADAHVVKAREISTDIPQCSDGVNPVDCCQDMLDYIHLGDTIGKMILESNGKQTACSACSELETRMLNKTDAVAMIFKRVPDTSDLDYSLVQKCVSGYNDYEHYVPPKDRVLEVWAWDWFTCRRPTTYNSDARTVALFSAYSKVYFDSTTSDRTVPVQRRKTVQAMDPAYVPELGLSRRFGGELCPEKLPAFNFTFSHDHFYSIKFARILFPGLELQTRNIAFENEQMSFYQLARRETGRTALVRCLNYHYLKSILSAEDFSAKYGECQEEIDCNFLPVEIQADHPILRLFQSPGTDSEIINQEAFHFGELQVSDFRPIRRLHWIISDQSPTTICRKCNEHLSRKLNRENLKTVGDNFMTGFQRCKLGATIWMVQHKLPIPEGWFSEKCRKPRFLEPMQLAFKSLPPQRPPNWMISFTGNVTPDQLLPSENMGPEWRSALASDPLEKLARLCRDHIAPFNHDVRNCIGGYIAWSMHANEEFPSDATIGGDLELRRHFANFRVRWHRNPRRNFGTLYNFYSTPFFPNGTLFDIPGFIRINNAQMYPE